MIQVQFINLKFQNVKNPKARKLFLKVRCSSKLSQILFLIFFTINIPNKLVKNYILQAIDTFPKFGENPL